MGRSSRHSKNAGVMGAETLTYNERRGQGYGTVKERLGKVLFNLSVSNFLFATIMDTPQLLITPIRAAWLKLYSQQIVKHPMLCNLLSTEINFSEALQCAGCCWQLL